ncbi:12151_t:CDS:2, partial [Gigaspora margarita]
YPILFSYNEQEWFLHKIPYKILLFEVIDLTINENSYDKENKEDEENIQEYEIYSTNINKAPNDKENATKLENSNEPPNNNKDSTIENSNTINSNVSTKQYRKFVSTIEFYTYRIQVQPQSINSLLLAGCLFQQFLVDIYVKIELGHLNFLRFKQKKIRSDLYKVKEARSFNDFKKVNGIKYGMFKESSLLRGFLKMMMVIINNENFEAMLEDFAYTKLLAELINSEFPALLLEKLFYNINT